MQWRDHIIRHSLGHHLWRSPTGHLRVVGTGPKVAHSGPSGWCTVTLCSPDRVQSLHLPLKKGILVGDISLEFLKDFEALVIPHLLSDLDGSQAVAVLLHEKLHASKVGEDDHGLQRVVGCGHV